MELESEEEDSEDDYVPGNFHILRPVFHYAVSYTCNNIGKFIRIYFLHLDKEIESSEEEESDKPSSEGEPSEDSESEEPTPEKVS